MKPPTVFLGEMTDPEVEAFLRDHRDGDRADRLDRAARPARSAADRRPRPAWRSPGGSRRGSAPLVAPPINYGLSYPHVGFTGVVHIRIPTFMALVEDLCAVAGGDRLPADRVPQRPLRQHLRDRVRLRQRRRPAARRRARVPGQLLGRHDRRRGGRVLRPDDRPPRQPGRDVGGHGDRPGARRHGPGQRRDAAVPGGDQPGRRPHRVLLLDAGLGPPGDRSRDVGRRPRVQRRVRRALPRRS